MTRTSGASLPENNTPASDDCTRQQRTTEGPDNPAKWADWGVYNYKAVVAYDGTNYKYAYIYVRSCLLFMGHIKVICMPHMQALHACLAGRCTYARH